MNMASILHLLGSAISPHPFIMATRQLLEQYMLHAATLLSQIESTRLRLTSLEVEHQSILKAIEAVQSQLES
jgi:hypothetical protein